MVPRFTHDPGIAPAVTKYAVGRDPRVIHRRSRPKRRRRLMARLAAACGREMIRRLAHDPGIAPAMTKHAVGRDPGVIHRRPRPEGRRRLMARLAPERGWNVARRLTQRRRAVMTGRAAGRDPRVIKRGPRKRRCGLVTILARGCGRNVIRRFAHDPGIAPAMTARTAGRDPRVVHRRPRPEGRRRLMARLAPERGWNVIGRLPWGHCAIVTTRTLASLHHRVSKESRNPTGSAVATVTIECGRNVRRWLEGRHHTPTR